MSMAKFVPIQLDLFDGVPADGGASSMSVQVNAPEGVKNPCLGCEYAGWCAPDDCAKKGYPIMVPTTRFKNLEEYIQFIKHYDWL